MSGDIDLFAFHNDTGKLAKFKASDYRGVSYHDKASGHVITNYGPAAWNPFYGQNFYDSPEKLFATIQGDGI